MDDLTTTEAFEPDRMVTVARFEDPVEAQMAKGMIESAGFECFLQGENANHLLGAAFRARLLVHKKDESAARELLATRDAEDGEPEEASEESEDEAE
jgi:hypothetical protein